MDIEEWIMDNGKWKINIEICIIESFQCIMRNAKFIMKMYNVKIVNKFFFMWNKKWKLEYGKFKMYDGKCLKIVLNGQMVPNGTKLSQMVLNGPK